VMSETGRSLVGGLVGSTAGAGAGGMVGETVGGDVSNWSEDCRRIRRGPLVGGPVGHYRW
jgi:hypothetical protein